MTENRSPSDGDPKDASDVVEGPVGSAHLKDPATSGPIGADLDELPAIDIPDAELPGEGRAIDGGAVPNTPAWSVDRG